MMGTLRRYLHWMLALTALLGAATAAAQSMVTDTRIKTLVYNPNDVYAIVTHYGYQSNIEFGRNEKIQTISVGDLVSWQVIPADTHLFVRALAENAHTNMTVITDKRTYQFDLFAKPVSRIKSEELAYVIRFYYPEEYGAGGISMPAAEPAPMASMPASFPGAIENVGGYNFRYSLSGPEDIAPLKVYDDGRSTFFQFASAASMPDIRIVDPVSGRETPAQVFPQGNVLMVNYVGPRFSIRSGGRVVCVFNEAPVRGAPTW